MKLIIDFGNSRIKLALFKNKELITTKIVNVFTIKELSDFCDNYTISSSIISTVRKLTDLEKKVASTFNYLNLTKKQITRLLFRI